MMRLDTFDLAKAVAAYALSIVAILSWVIFSGQTAIAKRRENYLGIAARLAVVHASAFLLVCVGFEFSSNIHVIMMGVLLVMFPIASLDNCPPDETAGLFVVTMSPAYLCTQFVLGFPDRNRIILQPPNLHGPRQSTAETMTELVKVGTTITPLKPGGIIDVDGTRLVASSVDGMYIESGQAVTICGRRHNVMLVRPAN